MDDLSVVKEEHGVSRQQFREMEELRLADSTITIDKQFRLVALCERELGDAFVREWVVVVGDGDFAWVIRHDGVYR